MSIINKQQKNVAFYTLGWQAYYYGPSKPSANGPTWGLRLPYELNMTIHDIP